jgi:cell division protein FtsW
MENAMVSRVERGPVADWFWTIDRLFLAVFVGLMGIGVVLSFAASPRSPSASALTRFTSSSATACSSCRPLL